jgi:hypothetical protein
MRLDSHVGHPGVFEPPHAHHDLDSTERRFVLLTLIACKLSNS